MVRGDKPTLGLEHVVLLVVTVGNVQRRLQFNVPS